MTYGRPYLEYRVVETGGDAGSDDARSALLPCRERARHVARTRICPGNWKVLIFVCWWIYAKIKMSFGKGERRPDPAREIQFSCNDTEKAQETHGMRCQKAHIDLFKRRSTFAQKQFISMFAPHSVSKLLWVRTKEEETNNLHHITALKSRFLLENFPPGNFSTLVEKDDQLVGFN